MSPTAASGPDAQCMLLAALDLSTACDKCSCRQALGHQVQCIVHADVPHLLGMQVEQDLAAALLDCTQLKQQLEALQQEQGQQASAQVQQLSAQVVALQQQHAQQAQQLQQQAGREAALLQQVQQSAQEVEQLSAQLSQVKEQLQQQEHSAAAEASVLRSRLQQAEDLLREQTQQNQQTPVTATHIEHMEGAGTSLEELQQQVEELQQQLVEAEQGQQGLQEALAHVQARAKRAEAQIKSLLQVRFLLKLMSQLSPYICAVVRRIHASL